MRKINKVKIPEKLTAITKHFLNICTQNIHHSKVQFIPDTQNLNLKADLLHAQAANCFFLCITLGLLYTSEIKR